MPIYTDNPDGTRTWHTSEANVASELHNKCHTADQYEAFSRPASDVKSTAVSLDQAKQNRDSYINGFLIQSRGNLANPPCVKCATRGPRPFTECRYLPGFWGGCCGNCKWRDHAARCSMYDENLQKEAVRPMLEEPERWIREVGVDDGEVEGNELIVRPANQQGGQ